jgi:hypothetical protein
MQLIFICFPSTACQISCLFGTASRRAVLAALIREVKEQMLLGQDFAETTYPIQHYDDFFSFATVLGNELEMSFT